MRKLEFVKSDLKSFGWQTDRSDFSSVVMFDVYKSRAFVKKRLVKRNNAYVSLTRFVHSMYPDAKKILDVGVGEGQTSFLFKECGYDVTAMDYCEGSVEDLKKALDDENVSGTVTSMSGGFFNPFVMYMLSIRDIEVKNEFFSLDTPIEDYDLVVGVHPCEATEMIIRNCLEHDKDFVVTPCEKRPSLDGKNFESRGEYIEYLKSLSSEIKSLTLPIYDFSSLELWGKTLYMKKKRGCYEIK